MTWSLEYLLTMCQVWTRNLGLLPLSFSCQHTVLYLTCYLRVGENFLLYEWNKYCSSAFGRKLDSCHHGMILWQVSEITVYIYYWKYRLLYHLSEHVDSAYFIDKKFIEQNSPTKIHSTNTQGIELPVMISEIHGSNSSSLAYLFLRGW